MCASHSRWTVIGAAVALVLCSCASDDRSAVETSPLTVASRTDDSEATARSTTSATSSSSTAVATERTVPGCVPQCRTGKLTRPGPLPVGTYTTVNFFDGALTVTVDEGWESNEDSTGEFELHRADGTAIFVWLDAYPVMGCATPGCPFSESERPVEGVGRDAAALAEWLHHNPNLTVEDGERLSLDGIQFDSLDVASADDAVDAEPANNCPSKPCVMLLGYPEWEIPFGIAHDQHLRLLLADVEYGDKSHLLVVGTDGPGTRTAIAQRVEPVLDAFDIPAVSS